MMNWKVFDQMHWEEFSTATMTVTVSLKLLMPVKIKEQLVELLGTVKRKESVCVFLEG